MLERRTVARLGNRVSAVRYVGSVGLVLLAAWFTFGCRSDPESTASVVPEGAWFVESAQQRGLDFRHRSGHEQAYLMPESANAGGGLFDMDNDGDLDAYLVQSGSLLDPEKRKPGNRLYRNDGSGNFSLLENTGAEDTGYGNGLACGDYDGDGDPDLYVTNVGANRLLRNDGDGRFTDVTEDAGVGHTGWGSTALFLDYDRDGDLDLFALNYIHWSVGGERECANQLGTPDYCGPLVYGSPAMDVLYRNDGNGRFTDVTIDAGLNHGFGNGLGTVAGDYNGDGWLDMFVANDGVVDQLWINGADGTFRDDALVAGCAVDMEGGVPKAGMGVTTADIDGDQDLDLMVCNLLHESDSVYRNDGGRFTDITAVSGLGTVSRQFTRFGMGWVDFDNDGWLDLYQANGRVMRALPVISESDPYAEHNLLFRGRPDGTFQEVRPRGGTDPMLAATSRAAAFGDVDGDGAIDVLVVNRDGPVHLLINRAPSRGNALRLRVLERNGRDAEGAVVFATIAGRVRRGDVRTGYSFQACNEPIVHFGLGAEDRAEAIEVVWVDGVREAFDGTSVGAVRTIRRGTGRSI